MLDVLSLKQVMDLLYYRPTLQYPLFNNCDGSKSIVKYSFLDFSPEQMTSDKSRYAVVLKVKESFELLLFPFEARV